MEVLAGIDIGGTNIRVALSPRGCPNELLIHRAFKTPHEKTPESIIEYLEDVLSSCLDKLALPKKQLMGVGCTLPGITDVDMGTAVFASNLNGWDGFSMQQAMEKQFKTRVVIENDVNAAAFGEYHYGAGKGSHSLIYFTISTGVAVGIVLQGMVWHGYNYSAGELGYFVPDPQHLDKDWMPNGCLESLAGGVGLGKLWKDHLEGIHQQSFSAKDVFRAAENKDISATQLIDRAANYMAQTAIAICTLLDPQLIVLSGSIAQHQPIFYERMNQVVQYMLPYPVQIIHSTLEGDAPLIGVLALTDQALTN